VHNAVPLERLELCANRVVRDGKLGRELFDASLAAS
jgi:hypothetical protein